MFTNQIPEFPDFGRKGIHSAKPTYTNDVPDLYHQPKEQPQGWGLTFMLTVHEAATGRGKNTAWWAGEFIDRIAYCERGIADDDDDAGLPNLFWWCDRETGVAGMIATQILPFCGEVLHGGLGWKKGKGIGIEDDGLIFNEIDADVIGLWASIETAIYKGLKAEEAGGR